MRAGTDGRVYAPAAYAGGMDDGPRIDALLQAAGLDARVSEADGLRPGGGTTARVVPLTDAGGRPVAVAKLAGPSVDDRRIDAEAHVLGVLGPRHRLPVPALLARHGRDLLLGWADDAAATPEPAHHVGPVFESRGRGGPRGPPGGGAAGPRPPGGGAPQAAAAVQSRRPAPPHPVARVCAARAGVPGGRPRGEDAAVLAPWGGGTANATAAFDRRRRRLHRRIDGFLALLPAEASGRWRSRLHRLGQRHAEACRIVATLGGDRLIHGDLHRGNLRLAGPAAILVDWQQASVGHPLVDVVRWLAEHGPPDAGACRDQALGHATAVDVAVDEPALAALLDTTLAGLVSGLGGRTPGTLRPEERAVIARALDERGWLATHAARGSSAVG